MGRQRFVFVAVAMIAVGCSDQTETDTPPLPRPISVIVLTDGVPRGGSRLSGAVGSWKVEDIGFEVSGRVQFVIEPAQDVDQRLDTNDYGIDLSDSSTDPDSDSDHDEGNSAATNDDTGDSPSTSDTTTTEDVTATSDGQSPGKHSPQPKSRRTGTLLARLDSSRYELQVQSVKAEMRTIERQKDALQIEIDDVVPAQISAAEADFEFLQAEYTRLKGLFDGPRKTITKSQLDQAEAKMKSAEAQVAQWKATQEAKRAEFASLDAQLDQQRNALADAERNVADCELYSPFRGEVARVHTIPGGYVERGSPVVTVQMMDPVKVEFEVSAEMARRLRYKDVVEIVISPTQGTPIRREAIVYMTDTTADPATRTFTITLLARNNKVRTEVPAEYRSRPVARTQDVWRLMTDWAEAPDSWFVEEHALQKDAEGVYLWKIMVDGDPAQAIAENPVFSVEKIRVIRGEMELDFLGIYNLVEVSIAEGEPFDPTIDLVTGGITLPVSDQGAWDGQTVLFERENWLMRPGDLVDVNLDMNRQKSGFYVPLNSIIERSDRKYLFIVEENEDGAVLRQVEVKAFDNVGKLIGVEAIDPGELKPGTKIAGGRVHYLKDGEAVTISESLEARP